MKKLLIFGMAAAWLTFSGVVHAYPTLTGPTGTAVLPSAEVAPAGVTVAADWHNISSAAAVVPGQNSGAIYPGRILIGLGPNVEIGGAYAMTSNILAPSPAATTPGVDTLDHWWDANAKYRFLHFWNGDFAVGGQFLRETAAGTDTDWTQGYLAWTTNFDATSWTRANVGFTLGANWTQVKAGPTGNTTSAFRYFTSIRYNATPSFGILAESQTQNSDLGDAQALEAFTARYAFDPNFVVQVGATNTLGLQTTKDLNFFAGASWAFGGSPNPEQISEY